MQGQPRGRDESDFISALVLFVSGSQGNSQTVTPGLTRLVFCKHAERIAETELLHPRSFRHI